MIGTKEYTLKHPCDIEGEVEGDYIALHSISSSDPEESRLLVDDGEYACWDAVVEFVDRGLRIVGSDGPSGGVHTTVVLFIPGHLVIKLVLRWAGEGDCDD